MKEEIDFKEDAIEHFFKATKFEWHEANRHYHLGLACSDLLCIDEAITAFEKAVFADPQHVKALCELGNHYKIRADTEYDYPGGRDDAKEIYEKAAAAYKKVIRLKPAFVSAHTDLGTIYAALGNHEEAVGAFKEAIRIRPTYAEAHYHLALTYLEMGDKSSAIEEYHRLGSPGSDLSKKLFCHLWPDQCQPSENAKGNIYPSISTESKNQKSEERRELT
jgi:tetratricopeptide (TPR) repeat protein